MKANPLLALVLATLALAVPPAGLAAQNGTIALAGKWRFQLDRQNLGIQEKWFAQALRDQVDLPGSLPEQGLGDDISIDTRWTGEIVDKSWFTAPEYARYRQPGNVKVPFWVQPEKYYVGVAWYQRDLDIPTAWQSRRVILTLERPHWATHVWLDEKEIGANDSLSTSHEYDLGTGLTPGRHQLTIRVDNSLVVDVGVNSHSISDHTQGNWNGIVGNLGLRAVSPVAIEELQVYPNLSRGSAIVRGVIRNATGQPGRGTVKLEAILQGSRQKRLAPQTVDVTWNEREGRFETEYPLGSGAEAWDEFHPALYRLTASLDSEESSRAVSFGLREIGTQGTQFVLNGHQIFIRGTLECCIFPKTGHPPTDVDSWKRIIRVAKAHGLNLIRFHSWCPPEAAFIAADELGFYYQVEIASWANQSTTLGDGKPVDEWLYREADRILKAYGNHPSFLLMPYGNEPGGNKANAYLARWVNHWKAADSRHLYTSGSGWPELAQNQFHVTPTPRIQAWGEGLKSRINAKPPETCTDYRDFIQRRSVPVISHEIGQWCVYPNFDEIPKYTGYLKPKNFEIFRDSLRAHHMGELAHRFLLASGKLQTLCYKEDIESALRTPGMGGFELLDLHDFPGQGTALVGVLDPFWEDKSYVTAEEFRRFCNSTVALARLKKRVFTTDETLEAQVEVAHFGPVPLPQTSTTWKLMGDNGKAVASGKFSACAVPLGNGIPLGSIQVDLHHAPAPARYKLVVSLSDASARPRAVFQNDWDIWVYPAALPMPTGPEVLIVNNLNEPALASLNSGGKVLLTIPANRVKGDQHGPVALGFSSIFWNTAWTRGQAPHTLGILCDPKHPALAQFPTDDHSNWQWWYLINRAGAMILDDLPRELRPTVQVIDDWFTNRKLALVFEAKVGPGKLLVCSADLDASVHPNPVVRQMRHSLLAYMASDQFRPRVAVTPDQIRGLINESSKGAAP